MRIQALSICVLLALGGPALAGGFGGGRGDVIRVRNPLNVAGPSSGSLYGSGRTLSLTDAYSILDQPNTSIFSSNRLATPIGPETRPTGDPPRAPTRAPAPVLRGVMFDDSGPMALLEVPDTRGSLSNVYLRPGQAFQQFTVSRITLDGLQLTSRTGTNEVRVGHSLDGVDASVLPTTSTYQSSDVAGTAVTPTRTPTNSNRTALRTPANSALLRTEPAVITPSLDPPLPQGSNDDLASRMALRRQNQLAPLPSP